MDDRHPLQEEEEALKLKLAAAEGQPERTRLQSTDELVGDHEKLPVEKVPAAPSPLPPPPRLHVTHSTTEALPILPSAPPSGADLSAYMAAGAGESFGESSATMSDNTSLTSTTNSPVLPTAVMEFPPPPKMSGATLVSLPPPPPPLVQEADLKLPSSSSSEPPAAADGAAVTEEEKETYLREPSKIFFPPSPSTPSFLARRHTHIPILVISTEHANQLAWKNQLRLTDLLEGLSKDLSDANVPLPPFRSAHRSMLLNWQDLQIAFVSPAEFEEGLAEDDALAQAWLHEEGALQVRDGDVASDMTVLEDQIDHLLADEAQKTDNEYDESDTHTMDMYKQRQRRLEQVTRDAFKLTSPPDMPWLVRYRRTLDATTDYLPHELFHTPPLVLLVCSSHEITSPLDCLRDLGSHHYLPASCFGRNAIMDAQQLRKEVLVLHDEVDGPQDLNEVALKQAMQRQYGSGASIVRINSVTTETAQLLSEQETADIWSGGGRCGHCLSQSDRSSLRRYLATMIASSLLPALERRIADLNITVTDKKKGVKNVFKSLWRKPKEESSPSRKATTTSGVVYRYDSIESQVRLLADTLFLLRDWEAALGTYRLIKDDYKHDRAMMHYASVQEMMALSSYMLDSYGRSREIFSLVETALYSYTRIAEDDRPAGMTRPTQAPLATRLATRLCLVLSSMSQIDRPLEVADLLASASSHETPLGAAVLLEQSSAHYYRAEMFRKYAFHMLMSGHMFRSAAQEHHAFRCFTSALYIYHDGRWDELHNHLRSALAAQLYSLGRMAVSLELYAKLVGTDGGGRVSIKSQQKFVNHLLDICKQHANKALAGADRMALPGSSNKELRKARFNQIDQVLAHTPHARRILELPNMDLPHFEEDSISVMVEAEAKDQHEFIPSFGTCSNGEDSVWEELMCCAEAELKVGDPSRVIPSKDDLPRSLAIIEDPVIRQTIALIDKERNNANLSRRVKKSAKQKPSPPIQARMEPLSVDFSMHNPLNIPIELCDIQLVAELISSEDKRVCTTKDAIEIQSPDTGREEDRSWAFQSSSQEFKTPQFGRISPTDSHSGTGAWTSVSEEDPYFVVTKQDLIIDAGSTVSLSLGICPLVKGDLEILGVRSKLFSDVWIYHPLNVKGPLLQDTSYNRANRVRAESVALKSRVEDDMPRLTVHLHPRTGSASNPKETGDSPMLLGQISQWSLQITNVGTAPATALSLKTNMPWIRIESAGGPSDVGEAAPAPNCVGPSGTFLAIPIQGVTLKTEGVIHPGETVDVPILIRSATGGKQDFYMLYRYEMLNSTGRSSKCRWLRKMVEVPVYPSLTFTASLMPSFWEKREHLLSVEMTNYRTDQSIEPSMHIDKLSILSRHYRIEPLEHQLADTPSEASAIQLGWQERVTMHYRVIPLEVESEACTVTECPLDGGSSTVVRAYTAAEAGGFLCLKHAHDEFNVALSKHQTEVALAAAEENGPHPRSIAQIRRAKSSISDTSFISSADLDHLAEDPLPSAHPTSVARLCPVGESKAKLNIICSWTAASEGGAPPIHGRNFITGLSVRPNTSSKGCPLTITCKHPPSVTHNFSRGPLHIPFDVTLRNRLLNDSVDFEFNMERPNAFDFVGTERFDWVLDAGDEITVPLQAAVATGGVYNLQNVRITTKKDSKKVSYVFPLQWTVVVDGVGA